MPRFTLLRGERIERSFVVDADLIRIGRHSSAEVLLDSPTVSRDHARIRRDTNAYVLVDSGSVNGVRLQGRRVGEQPLSRGDTIEIEEFQLVFEPSGMLYSAGLAPALRGEANRSGSDTDLTFHKMVPLPDEQANRRREA